VLSSLHSTDALVNEGEREIVNTHAAALRFRHKNKIEFVFDNTEKT